MKKEDITSQPLTEDEQNFIKYGEKVGFSNDQMKEIVINGRWKAFLNEKYGTKTEMKGERNV